MILIDHFLFVETRGVSAGHLASFLMFLETVETVQRVVY